MARPRAMSSSIEAWPESFRGSALVAPHFGDGFIRPLQARAEIEVEDDRRDLENRSDQGSKPCGHDQSTQEVALEKYRDQPEWDVEQQSRPTEE